MEMLIKIAILLTATTVTCPTVNIKAENTYITDSGRTCIMCPPGHYHKDDCEVPNTIALCEACPPGTFSSTYNRAVYCAPCRSYCESDILVTVQKCTATTNMECDCPPGMIMKNHGVDKRHARCKPFRGCEPGSGVLVKGTSEHEPKCAECRPGTTFSPEMSSSEPCYPCTQCPNDDFFQECNTTHDSICNVPRHWCEDVVIPSLISNGVLAFVITTIIITIIIGKKRGWFCKPERKLSNDTEEECRPMNSKHSSDSGLDRYSNDLELEQLARESIIRWDAIFRCISCNLTSDWNTVISDLFDAIDVGDCDTIIEQIALDNNTVKERIYQCLMKWNESGNPRSTHILVSVLTKHNKKTLLKTLRTTFPSEFPSSSCAR